MISDMKRTENQCLSTILKDCKIVVPIIQRDYAQGRDDENVKSIRTNFIEKILNKLECDSKLKLNFVYGTKNADEFIPYDGQQRLTLMYLFSLYFENYAEYPTSNRTKLEKFCYRTRDFATEFCKYISSEKLFWSRNHLAEIPHGPLCVKEGCSLQDRICDDIGFITAWKTDPTVESMLCVFQTIHDMFNARYNSKSVEERKLIAGEYAKKLQDGYVFFDCCELNASDLVYVKMNGRGRPLSIFDNFKNTLYEVLDDLLKKNTEKLEYNVFLKDFKLKMERDWTKLFWTYRNEFCAKANDISSAMMNIFFTLFEYRFVSRFEKDLLGKDQHILSEKNIIRFISAFKNAFEDGESNTALGLEDFVWVSNVLDIMYYRYLDKTTHEVKDSFSNRVYLEDEIKPFIAICSTQSGTGCDRSHIEFVWLCDYLVKSSSFDSEGNLIAINSEFTIPWIRFMFNLMETTRTFDGHFNDLFDKYIYATLSKLMNEIFSISPDGNFDKGCSEIADLQVYKTKLIPHVTSQFVEEVLKSKLRILDTEWTEKLAEAENIRYFAGQIYFLIDCSKDESNSYDINKFEKLCNAVKSLQIENVMNDFAIRTLLLSTGDYRMKTGNTKTIGISSPTKFEYTWRHIFDYQQECKMDDCKGRIQNILNIIVNHDYDVDSALNEVRQQMATNSEWYAVLIQYPELLKKVNQYGIVADSDKGVFVVTAPNVKKQIKEDLINSHSINVIMYDFCRKLGYTHAELDNKFGYSWSLDKHGLNLLVKNDGLKLQKEGTIVCEGSFDELLDYVQK